jgi:hypothetical protein
VSKTSGQTINRDKASFHTEIKKHCTSKKTPQQQPPMSSRMAWQPSCMDNSTNDSLTPTRLSTEHVRGSRRSSLRSNTTKASTSARLVLEPRNRLVWWPQSQPSQGSNCHESTQIHVSKRQKSTLFLVRRKLRQRTWHSRKAFDAPICVDQSVLLPDDQEI